MTADRLGKAASSLALACAVAGTAASADAKSSTVTVGVIETVRVDPGGMTLDAKIDTGADGSSIDARDIQEFTRDGKPWVRFTVPLGKQSTTLELPVERTVKIKRRNGAPSLVRPVVRMQVCIGGMLLDAPVNLMNRANFNYRMLIGRKLLAGRAIVDPGRDHVTEPRCPRTEK